MKIVKFSNKHLLKIIVFWIVTLITILPILIPIIFWEPIMFFISITEDDLTQLLSNIQFYILAPLLPLFIIILYAKCAKSIIKNEKLDNDLYLLYILVVIGYILIDKF